MYVSVKKCHSHSKYQDSSRGHQLTLTLLLQGVGFGSTFQTYYLQPQAKCKKQKKQKTKTQKKYEKNEKNMGPHQPKKAQPPSDLGPPSQRASSFRTPLLNLAPQDPLFGTPLPKASLDPAPGPLVRDPPPEFELWGWLGVRDPPPESSFWFGTPLLNSHL